MYLYPYSILLERQPKGDPKFVPIHQLVYSTVSTPGDKSLDEALRSWIRVEVISTDTTKYQLQLCRDNYREGEIQRAIAQPSGDPESQKTYSDGA